jgi:hypothetical protein
MYKKGEDIKDICKEKKLMILENDMSAMIFLKSSFKLENENEKICSPLLFSSTLSCYDSFLKGKVMLDLNNK